MIGYWRRRWRNLQNPANADSDKPSPHVPAGPKKDYSALTQALTAGFVDRPDSPIYQGSDSDPEQFRRRDSASNISVYSVTTMDVLYSEYSKVNASFEVFSKLSQ